MGVVGNRLDCRILIVEDNVVVGQSLKAVLEDAGAWVQWVQSDQAAYAAIEAGLDALDVLILDVDLGVGTTGFDIARHARRRRAEIGIIFSSGSPPDWVSAFGVENALFVPKPASESDLLTAIALVAKGRGGGGAKQIRPPLERPFML